MGAMQQSLPRLLLLLFAFCAAIVANGQANTKRYSEDCALVTDFMANNGSYVVKYGKAKEIYNRSTDHMGIAPTIYLAGEAAKLRKEARSIMDDFKAKMVDIHASPKDWTVDDLQKMKTDPKGAEAFKALVRVRDAMYGNEYSAEIKKYLIRKLQNAIPGEEMAVSELRALLDRVQTVGGGQPSNQ